MGGIREDNSIQSANTPAAEYLAQNRANKDYNIYRCMVAKVRYIDDQANPTSAAPNPQVVYDCIIVGGPREGQILPNVRASAELGGQYNYSETILRAASSPFSGSGSKPFSKQDGDVVYVTFANGNLSAPVIIASGEHPSDATNTGATKADGPRSIREYNGVYQEVNKAGEWLLRHKGGKYDDEKDAFVPSQVGSLDSIKNETAGSYLQLDKKGSVNIKTFSGSSVVINNENGSEAITILHKTGSVIKLQSDGSIKFIAEDGSYLQLDSQGGINAASSKVNLGTNPADSAVLGNMLQTYMDLIITTVSTYLDAHVHDIILPLPGTPTSPPIVPSTPIFTPLKASIYNAIPASSWVSLFVKLRDNL